MIDELYNSQILTAASRMSHVGRLNKPQATAFKQAKYCGSTIIVDLNMRHGVVTDFAQEVRACALGQAAASIVAQDIIGTCADELKNLHQSVSVMLKEGMQGGEVNPFGKFSAFSMLQPAHAYKARHGSILLVLDGVLDCIKQIEMNEQRKL